MTTRRHANLDDIAQGIEARLDAYCPLLKSTITVQDPQPLHIAQSIINTELLPAAAVLIGDWDVNSARRQPALPMRELNVGILIIGDASLLPETRATTFWAIVDQVHRAFLPASLRDEDEGHPVVVLGDQTGDDRGVMLAPTGFTPLDTKKIPNRAAAILSLTLYDDVRDRADVPSLTDGDPIPVNDASIQIQYSADGDTWSADYTSGDPYARFSVDGGTVWSTSLLFRGAAGVDGGTSNLDGGTAASIYGGVTAIDGGTSA
jgi:hypothetical protein